MADMILNSGAFNQYFASVVIPQLPSVVRCLVLEAYCIEI